MLLFATGTTPGVGSQVDDVPRADGRRRRSTTVAAPDACASNVLDFQATLGTPMSIPADGQHQVARRLEPAHQGQLRQPASTSNEDRQGAGRLLPGQDRRRSADELHWTSSRSRPRSTRSPVADRRAQTSTWRTPRCRAAPTRSRASRRPTASGRWRSRAASARSRRRSCSPSSSPSRPRRREALRCLDDAGRARRRSRRTAAADGGYYGGALGARAAGRAGAFVARADDPTAVAYNPAGLADDRRAR